MGNLYDAGNLAKNGIVDITNPHQVIFDYSGLDDYVVKNDTDHLIVWSKKKKIFFWVAWSTIMFGPWVGIGISNLVNYLSK